MEKLTEIIKKDLYSVGLVAKGLVKGGVQGLYTPFLMNTGVRQFIHTADEAPSCEEAVAGMVAQCACAVWTHIPLAAYAVQQGKGKEYFGAMIASNIIDYLVHAYKRSKEGK